MRSRSRFRELGEGLAGFEMTAGEGWGPLSSAKKAAEETGGETGARSNWWSIRLSRG
jgi:hypothetical protein